MRRILVDYARRRRAARRGGAGEDSPLEAAVLAVSGAEKSTDLIALDAVLERLAEFDEQQARIVELRYFSGLSIEETAEALRISPATVKSDWNIAKAWLRRELTR